MERRAFLGGIGLVGAAAFGVGGARAQDGRAEWASTGREPADPTAMTPEELAHAPVLSLPSAPRLGRPFDLAVQVGQTPLAPTDEHRVDWIEVRLDERTVFVADLSADVPYPVVRVPIVLTAPATLIVRARCSAHGVWTTRRVLSPT